VRFFPKRQDGSAPNFFQGLGENACSLQSALESNAPDLEGGHGWSSDVAVKDHLISYFMQLLYVCPKSWYYERFLPGMLIAECDILTWHQ